MNVKDLKTSGMLGVSVLRIFVKFLKKKDSALWARLQRGKSSENYLKFRDF